MRSRVAWLSAVSAAVVTTAVVTAALAGPHDVRRERAAPVDAPHQTSAGHARAVLRGWDRRRAAAWAHADPERLARLYVPGSTTGRRDVAMLSSYRRGRLRVTGMTRQVVRLRMLHDGPRRLGLVVTDRLVDARVVGPGVRSAVPDGRLGTRRMSLVRLGGRWRMTEVTRVAGQPAR